MFMLFSLTFDQQVGLTRLNNILIEIHFVFTCIDSFLLLLIEKVSTEGALLDNSMDTTVLGHQHCCASGRL